jgi:signal transduction histidine kinase
MPTIMTERVHTHFIFRVADDGPGIAPQYQDRIFGMFQTLAPRDKVEGSGLGLSLVKKMVEHQGGRIWVQSKEGQGATFCFTWPKSTQSTSGDTAQSTIGRRPTRDPRNTVTRR